LDYRTDALTVEEYLLYQSVLKCCGDCYGYYRTWAELIKHRVAGHISMDALLKMPRYRFLEEVKACTAGIREAEEITSVVEGLNKGWQWESRNPIERWPKDKARKLEELKKAVDRGTIT
jgi:hypothetical protein